MATPVNGGAGRDRTDDLLVANQALSRLSYGPLPPPTTTDQAAPGPPSLMPDACLMPAPLRPDWWAWVDSNYRPHAYQACALTA